MTMTKHAKRNRRKYRKHIKQLINDILFDKTYLDIPLTVSQRITVTLLESILDSI